MTITRFMFAKIIDLMSQGKIQNRYTVHNVIQLIKGGDFYFQLLGELIDKARHSIFIRVYIWDDDATGTRIADPNQFTF